MRRPLLPIAASLMLLMQLIGCGGDDSPADMMDLAPECADSFECDDGVTCNGSELCVEGQCRPGSSPCTGGTVCHAAADECVGCVTDAHCDDGLFCTGMESCVGQQCRAGTPPCSGGLECRESNDDCY